MSRQSGGNGMQHIKKKKDFLNHTRQWESYKKCFWVVKSYESMCRRCLWLQKSAFWWYEAAIQCTRKMLISRWFVARHQAQGEGLSAEPQKMLFGSTKRQFDAQEKVLYLVAEPR
jgi:hypothetical protein